MPIQIKEPPGTNILIVHATGKLVKEDYLRLVPEVNRLVQQHGKIRLLFDLVDFHGWEAAAAWQDLKLGFSHFSDIERLALVGERKWQETMANFVKHFIKAEVRYFERIDAAVAYRWIEGDRAHAKAGNLEYARHGD